MQSVEVTVVWNAIPLIWYLCDWHGPLTRYVKLWIMHTQGMPGTFSPPPTLKKKTLVSDPGMHHGTCLARGPFLPQDMPNVMYSFVWRDNCFTMKFYENWLYFPSWISIPWYQVSWGHYGTHVGPTGPRWATSWPHELCYLGLFDAIYPPWHPYHLH